MKKTILIICIFFMFIMLVPSTPVADRINRRYYPLFWFGKTNYRNPNLYRNVKWSFENFKRRSTTISYVEIGSAWGR